MNPRTGEIDPDDDFWYPSRPVIRHDFTQPAGLSPLETLQRLRKYGVPDLYALEVFKPSDLNEMLERLSSGLYRWGYERKHPPTRGFLSEGELLNRVGAEWERSRRGGVEKRVVLQPAATVIAKGTSARWPAREVLIKTELDVYFCGLPKKHFSDKPLDKLSRISMKLLFVNRIHKGRYLLARIVTEPNPAGDAIALVMFNYPLDNHYTGGGLDTIFPLGSIVAIREPYLDGSSSIRIESPSDFVFLSDKDAATKGVQWKASTIPLRRPNPAESLKQAAEHFLWNDFLPAVAIYNDALRYSVLDNAELPIQLRLNSAAAKLRIDNFMGAAVDVHTAISSLTTSRGLDPAFHLRSDRKAFWRIALSKAKMGEYEDAIIGFEALETSYEESGSGEGRVGIEWVKARMREADTGCYDFVELARNGATRIEAASYTDHVKAEKLSGRGGGRGIIATRNIKQGDLLIVEKAFHIAFPDEAGGEQAPTIDIARNIIFPPTHARHVEGICAKLMADPSSSSQVGLLETLYAGPSLPPSGSRDPDQICPIDVERLENICTFNDFHLRSYGQPPVHLPPPPRKFLQVGDSTTSSALFLTTSLFNHSCRPDALIRLYGDLLVVRASRNIFKGAEILISYVQDLPTENRAPLLDRHLGRKGCDCDTSGSDSKIGPSGLRRRNVILSNEEAPLIDGLRAAVISNARGQQDDMLRFIPLFQNVIRSFEATYPAGDTFRPLLLLGNRNISHILAMQPGTSHLPRSIDFALSAFAAMGFKIVDASPTTLNDTAPPMIVLPKSSPPRPPRRSRSVLLRLAVAQKAGIDEEEGDLDEDV